MSKDKEVWVLIISIATGFDYPNYPSGTKTEVVVYDNKAAALLHMNQLDQSSDPMLLGHCCVMKSVIRSDFGE